MTLSQVIETLESSLSAAEFAVSVEKSSEALQFEDLEALLMKLEEMRAKHRVLAEATVTREEYLKGQGKRYLEELDALEQKLDYMLANVPKEMQRATDIQMDIGLERIMRSESGGKGQIAAPAIKKLAPQKPVVSKVKAAKDAAAKKPVVSKAAPRTARTATAKTTTKPSTLKK